MPVQNFLDAVEAGTALPPLFASTKRAFSGRARGGAIVKIVEGQRVRVLRPYKSGDVGITTVLDHDKDDEARAVFAELTNFSERP